MADTKVYLSGGRIQGRSDDSVVGSDEEIILDDNPSSQFSWGTGIGDYAPTTPTPSNHNNYNGVFINTNSVLKGKTLKKIKAWLCKFGSPNTSGTIRLGVMSGTGSGSTITWVTDAYVDIENLISGESGGVTLNTGFPATAVPIEITLPTAHVLAENDNIALGVTGGNYGSSANIAWQYSDGTGVYDGSNTSRNRFSNGAWTGSGMSSDMHTTITVEGTTAKDKTSITNVAVGTRYEETDTRKIFRRTAAYAGYDQTNVDEDVPLRDSWGGGTRGGIIIQAGHTLIGNAINKVTFRSKKNGSPSGTAYLRIWNNSGTVVYEVGSKLASEFPTSRGDVVFENTTASYTVGANDTIALDYTGGDATNNVTWGMKNSSSPTNENVRDYPSDAWRTQSGRQTSYKAEHSASWKEKGTA